MPQGRRRARAWRERVPTGTEVPFYRILCNFKVYQDRIATNSLQLFAHPEISEWFYTIPGIFEVNIVAEQKQALLVTIYLFLVCIAFNYFTAHCPYTAVPAYLLTPKDIDFGFVSPCLQLCHWSKWWSLFVHLRFKRKYFGSIFPAATSFMCQAQWDTTLQNWRYKLYFNASKIRFWTWFEQKERFYQLVFSKFCASCLHAFVLQAVESLSSSHNCIFYWRNCVSEFGNFIEHYAHYFKGECWCVIGFFKMSKQTFCLPVTG